MRFIVTYQFGGEYRQAVIEAADRLDAHDQFRRLTLRNPHGIIECRPADYSEPLRAEGGQHETR